MATSWTTITAGTTKITAAIFNQLHAAGKTELARRGRSHSYSISKDAKISASHLSGLRNALNSVRSRSWTDTIQAGTPIKKVHFDEMRSHINLLEGKAKVGNDSGCSSGCVGLCQGCSGSCTGGCTGCRGTCTGSCDGCDNRWF